VRGEGGGEKGKNNCVASSFSHFCERREREHEVRGKKRERGEGGVFFQADREGGDEGRKKKGRGGKRLDVSVRCAKREKPWAVREMGGKKEEKRRRKSVSFLTPGHVCEREEGGGGDQENKEGGEERVAIFFKGKEKGGL